MKSNIYMHPTSARSPARAVLIQHATGLRAVVDGRIVRLERPQQSAQSNFGQWSLWRKAR